MHLAPKFGEDRCDRRQIEDMQQPIQCPSLPVERPLCLA
jgi:hypothetical protein